MRRIWACAHAAWLPQCDESGTGNKRHIGWRRLCKLTTQTEACNLTESDLRGLQVDILSYLLEHPEAKDTVEGIMHWWLPRQRAQVGIDDVRHALDELVNKGWLAATSAGQTKLYALEPGRRDEIARWVKN
jgi:hypothetical protein